MTNEIIAEIKFNDKPIGATVKVFVVWDNINEYVESVHWTEVGAQERVTKLEAGQDRTRFDYDEFEVSP